MFTHKHYVPILKAKDGEFKAIQETFQEAKELMTPLFEVMNIAWDYEDEKEAKTIEDHLSKIGGKIEESFGNKPCFLDSNFLDGERKMSDERTHHLTYLFTDFRERKLNVIPTVGLNRVISYKTAVNEIIDQDKKGVCLRLTNIDLAKVDIIAEIQNEMQFYNIMPKDVDLIIDMESIFGINYGILSYPVITFINSLPFVKELRTLTVASAAFPSDLSDISPNTIEHIERSDWSLWNSIISAKLTRLPSFGDYSISHPVINELDPRLITISASIRYTLDDTWLIFRGRSTKKHGWEQYYRLCELLINMGIPPYCGTEFSWGDKYISDCAYPHPTVGTGNSTTWRKVTNNHHFHKVIFQISNLL